MFSIFVLRFPLSNHDFDLFSLPSQKECDNLQLLRDSNLKKSVVYSKNVTIIKIFVFFI